MVLTAGPVYFGGANLQIQQQGYNHMRNEQDSENRNRSMQALLDQQQHHQGGRMSLPGSYHANQPMLLTPEMQMEQRLAAPEHQMSAAPVSQGLMVDSKSGFLPPSGGEYVISEGTVYIPQYHQPGPKYDMLANYNGVAEMNGNGVTEAEKEIKDCIEKFQLRDDQARRDIAVKDLRHVIPMLIIYCFGGKGEPSQKKVKGLWDRPPANWPAGVPYLDPNNAQKSKGEMCKPKKETLMKMFNFLMQTYWDMQRRRGSSSSASGSLSPASSSPVQESKFSMLSPQADYMYQGSGSAPTVECNGNLPYSSLPASPEQHVPVRTSPDLSLQPQSMMPAVTSYSVTNPGTRYTVKRVGQDVTNGNGLQALKRLTTMEHSVMVKDEASHQQQFLQQQQQQQLQMQQQQQQQQHQQQQQSHWSSETHMSISNTPSPPSQKSGFSPTSPASSSDSVDSSFGSPPDSSTSSTSSSCFSKKHRLLHRTQSQSAPDGAPQNLMNGFPMDSIPGQIPSQNQEFSEPMDMSSNNVTVIAPISSPSSSPSSSSPPAVNPVPQYAPQGWNPVEDIMNRIENKMSQVKANGELLEAEARIGLLCIIKDLLWKMRPVLKNSSEQEQNFLEKLHDFECTLDVVQQFRSMPPAHHNKWQEFQDCRGEFYKPGWPGQKELIIAPGLHTVSHEEVVATEEPEVLKDPPQTKMGLVEEDRRVKGLVPVASSCTEVREICGKQLQLYIKEGDQMKPCSFQQLMMKLNIKVKNRPTSANQDELQPKPVHADLIAQDHPYNISEATQLRKLKKGARYHQGHQNVKTTARKDVEEGPKDAELLVRGGDPGQLADGPKHKDNIGPEDGCSSSGYMDCTLPDALDPFLDLINTGKNFDDIFEPMSHQSDASEVEVNDSLSFETVTLTDLHETMKALLLNEGMEKEGSGISTNGSDPLWSHGGHVGHRAKFLPPTEPRNKTDEDLDLCDANMGTSLKTKMATDTTEIVFMENIGIGADISDQGLADAFEADVFEDTDILKANFYSDSSALDVALSLTGETGNKNDAMKEVMNTVVLGQMPGGASFAETEITTTANVTTVAENQDHQTSFCDPRQQIEAGGVAVEGVEKAELTQGNMDRSNDIGKQLAALDQELNNLSPTADQEVENEPSEGVFPDEADPLGSIPTVVAEMEEQFNSDSDDESKDKRRSKKRKRKN